NGTRAVPLFPATISRATAARAVLLLIRKFSVANDSSHPFSPAVMPGRATTFPRLSMRRAYPPSPICVLMIWELMVERVTSDATTQVFPSPLPATGREQVIMSPLPDASTYGSDHDR